MSTAEIINDKTHRDPFPWAEDSVLEITDLSVHFHTDEGLVRAVNGVTLDIPRGKVTGIVGESGCGKSVTSYAVLRIIEKPGEIVSGRVLFNSDSMGTIDLTALKNNSPALFDVRGGKISMIFQEPMTALSPVHTIGNQVCEAILLHQDMTKKQARDKAVEMLHRVGIPGPAKRLEQYPFELSGGMRQRVIIAMAMVCNPEVLIADEPTTALDVTIQAQIMKLIKDLQEDFGTTTILITHDLGVIGQMADVVAVMYLGRIVELAETRELIHAPRHPYTMGLLKSLPSLSRGKKLPFIPGSVPSPAETPPGCPYHPRCPHAVEGRCDVGGPPPLFEVDGRPRAACLRVHESEVVSESQSYSRMFEK